MERVLDNCMRTWKKLGVSRDAREEMAAELDADLRDAGAAGISAERYVGGDAHAFAAAWARERGVVRPRLRLGLLAAAALLGAVPGAAFGLFAAYGLSSDAFAEMFGGEIEVAPGVWEASLDPPAALILALYALGAAFAYAGALAAVRAALVWRGDPAAAHTVRALTAWLPLVVLTAIGATVTFSWALGHSTRPWIVIADAVVAASVLAAGTALVRALAIRETRRGPNVRRFDSTAVSS